MSRSLTKYIKDGSIKIKTKSETREKLNPNKLSSSYKLYLQGGGKKKESIQQRQKKEETKKEGTKKEGTKKEGTKKEEKKQIAIVRNKSKKAEPTIRIIRGKKDDKNKHKFTRKNSSKIKDINAIEEQIQKNKKKNEIINEIKKSSKQSNKQSNKRSTKRNSKRNNSKKKNSKKKNSKKKNSRKVSLKSQKRASAIDIQKVTKKIEEIRKKKSSEIKEELEKDGIKVSGKSKRLLKDIYLYSKVCNINIKHE